MGGPIALDDWVFPAEAREHVLATARHFVVAPSRVEGLSRTNLGGTVDRPEVPDEALLWDRFLRLPRGMGWVTLSTAGYPSVALSPSALAHVLLSPAVLHRYVHDFVEVRARSGLDEGLDSGLPNPLIDSVVELLGSQPQGVFDYELEGPLARTVRSAL